MSWECPHCERRFPDTALRVRNDDTGEIGCEVCFISPNGTAQFLPDEGVPVSELRSLIEEWRADAPWVKGDAKRTLHNCANDLEDVMEQEYHDP